MSFIEEGLDANSIGEQSRKKKSKNKTRVSGCEAKENNGHIRGVLLENSDAQATKTRKKCYIKKRKKKEAGVCDDEETANVQELGPEDNDDGMIEINENKTGLEGAFEHDETCTDHVDSQGDPGSDFKDDKVRKKNKKKRKEKFLDEVGNKEEDANVINVQELGQESIDGEKVDRGDGKRTLQEDLKQDESDTEHMDSEEDLDSDFNDKVKKQNKRKQLLVKEAAEADKRAVCYLSRIPPHMDHVKLRHILSQYGEIKRIYLAPEDPTAQVKRKQAGGFRGKEFSEGWVEFAKKSVAKRVAEMLNGEQIGGRKRSSYYYDLWNIKYLSKFKWADLTEEIADKAAVRTQKLTLELSAAKKERDFYLAKVDQSRALTSIKERLKKKQKRQEDSAKEPGNSPAPLASKVIRIFPQKQPVTKDAAQAKPRLSKAILSGVFGAS